MFLDFSVFLALLSTEESLSLKTLKLKSSQWYLRW